MTISDNAEEQRDPVVRNLSNDLVSDPGEILNVLADSKSKGTTVGILASPLGDEMLLTAVREIIFADDITIILQNYDRTGYILETNKLKLGEIKSVYPFKSPFENPYMRTMKKSKLL